MIIKSMARKDPGFRQLLDYFHRDDDRQSRFGRHKAGHAFARNCYHDGADRDAVIGAFERNHRFLPKRRNGNALYHEIIVLEQDAKAPKERQAEILLELAEAYCEMRAPGQLAYGCVHQDRDHQHIHLMISANAARSKRRVRLPKARFAEIQCEMERIKLERYPELSPLRVYTRDPAERQAAKLRTREQEAGQRTGMPSKKQELAERIAGHLAAARSDADLTNRLSNDGLALYRRGTIIGIEDRASGRKHRLRTLGLMDALEIAQDRFRQPDRKFPDPDRAQTVERPHPSPSSTPEPARPGVKLPRPADREPPAQTTSPPEPEDPRAALLIRRRTLEREARERLDGFDRGDR